MVRKRPARFRTVPFTIYTHCGVDIVSVGGDWYQAKPPANDGNGNRPAGWDTPTDTGELSIYEDGTARFTSHAGHVATFVKLPEKPTLKGCD